MFGKMKEWKEKGYFVNPWTLVKGAFGVFPLMAAMLRHPSMLTGLFRSGGESRDDPEPIEMPYEIPQYKEGMSHCNSKERYLRPTYFCESDAPEIIALANELGAFQKSDREYAEAAFQWVQHNVRPGLIMSGALGTLKSGKAVCVDRTSLFIALCRAGGIPAKYRIAREVVTEQFIDGFAQDPMTRMLMEAMGGTDIISVAETKIGDEWVRSYLNLPEWAALTGVPISHLGEDSVDFYSYRPHEAKVMEGLPVVVGMGKILFRLMGRKRINRMNAQFDERYRKGKKILDEIGLEEYDRRIRESYHFIMPRISL